jgi:ligand-binding SRPBCC domain-containing protein
MKTCALERSQLVPRSRDEVFSFFEDATNLARITPPFLGFRILTPTPIPMGEGTLIDYRISIFGVPVKWRTRIESYDRGVRFVDTQLRGPYRLWRHTHEFEDARGGTAMLDRVEYAIGFGPIGSLARALFVRRMLDRIFDYRRDAVAQLFEGERAPPTSSDRFVTQRGAL